MFDFLKGILIEKGMNRVVIEVGGIGYELIIPASTYERLPETGKEVKIYTWVSSGMYGQGGSLYGFSAVEERAVFLLLRSIPKLSNQQALNILFKVSKSFEDFKSALIRKDIPLLSSIFGLTRRTAEKLALGLRDKIAVMDFGKARKFVPGQTQEFADAIQGLIALGYKEREAREAVSLVRGEAGDKIKAEEIVKLALRKIGRE